MFGLLKHKLFGSKSSKNAAKSRLQFVLVQDRTGLTNEEMAKFRQEMVEVIEKYFVIDEQGFDIEYKRDNDTTTLFINSPVVVKREEGIGHRVGARHNGSRAQRKKARAAQQTAQPVANA